jgi:predicted transcriptional regulator
MTFTSLSSMFRGGIEMDILCYLVGINNRAYITQIRSDLNRTYAHVCKLVYLLEKKGLVTTSKEGRKNYVTLTLKGRKIGNNLLELKKLFNPPSHAKQ